MTKAEKRAIRSDAWRQAISHTKAARREDRADRPAPQPIDTPAHKVQDAGPDPVAVTIYTDAPSAWYGVKLYDWGSKGLRGEGNVKRGDSRPRKTFDLNWVKDYATFAPNAPLTRAVKALTAEVWPIHVRKGKWWRLSHYITSAKALELARATLPAAAPEAPRTSPAVEPEPMPEAPRTSELVASFVAYLDASGIPFVRVTEAKARAALSGLIGHPPIGALDVIAYNDGGQNMLVQVVDRLDGEADAGALAEWARVYGVDFAPVLAWPEGATWYGKTLDGAAMAFASLAAELDGIPL